MFAHRIDVLRIILHTEKLTHRTEMEQKARAMGGLNMRIAAGETEWIPFRDAMELHLPDFVRRHDMTIAMIQQSLDEDMVYYGDYKRLCKGEETAG